MRQSCEYTTWVNTRRNMVPSNATLSSPHPDKFYKSRSQEKTHLLRLEFFLLRSPLDRARSVLNCRAMDSGSIKVEVKKKHISCGWSFSCFAAHLIERDLF